MTQEIRFPFRLHNAIFTSLEFRRQPEMPEPLQLQLSTEIRIHDDKFPDRLQIDLRLKTPGEQPLKLFVELVSLFDLVEDQPKPDRSIIPDFINQQALYMVWPYMTQMVKYMTGQMGTSSVNVPTPLIFSFKPPEEKPTVDE